MNDQTEILDSAEGEVVDAEISQSEAIGLSLDRVRSDVAAFDRINAGLAKLRKQHPADLVVDVTTPAGMKLAIAARAAYRDPRVALERARKSAKAPVLELGRSIDKFAASIEEQLRIGESNYHDQIKVEEERKAREKKAAEEAEAARVQQIQGRIAFLFTTKPMRLVGKDAQAIYAALNELREQDISEAVFAELTQDAFTAKEDAERALIDMHATQRNLEAEAARQRSQAEENRRKQEELRKQQEDFEAEQRAHREQVARELAERNAKEEAERRARAAELAAIQKAKDDLAATQRAEADRLAALERARLDAEAAERRAEEDRQAAAARAAFEEVQRVAEAERLARAKAVEEKAAAEAEKARKAVEAAQKKAMRDARKLAVVQRCGPRLLAALKGCVAVADRETDEFIEARAAIAEAEAE